MDLHIVFSSFLIYCSFVLFFTDVLAKSNIPTVHYDEIGCKPVYAIPSWLTERQPFMYNCTEVINKLNEGYCTFAGNFYKDGEVVDSKTLRNCILGCSCTKDRYTHRPVFACAVADCFPIPLGKGCHYKSKFGQCCPTESVCPPFDEVCIDMDNDNTALSKKYSEGEAFNPKSDKCQKCICKKDLEGKMEAECERIHCNTGLFNSDKFSNYCAPIYRKNDLCCPYAWKCHDFLETDTQIENVGEKYNGHLGKDECRFGTRVMKIETKFHLKSVSMHERDVDCECQIPPFVTCYLDDE